ncbi:MAG: hypothetical protein PF542_03770 [Nanoarchaeota archaeon]|jgi:predicted CopG family antitoxin|nr:hypothetical protein [Nanoarchaeota archaeon]
MTKIISISDEAYQRLSTIKGGDSFTKVILKIVKAHSNKEKILSFAGKKGIDENLLKKTKKDWNKWSKRYA